MQDAIAKKRPLVALESTIITHGLPYPANYDMARQVEDIVREEGCVPATCAFIDGVGHVGIDDLQLKVLASGQNYVKISRRDIPSVVANKLTGGTTIASTMILANKAGIKVFGTGGLGGVHRGVAETWDISADLEELGRTPVAVVCAGPKSILDIPKTLEFLETKGVPVYTLEQENVPGFFTRDSGVKSPFTFDSPREAADIISAGTKFGLNQGSVWCVPCPKELAMSPELVNGAIEIALAEADEQGITGKDTTPFLLKKVWEFTQGDTVSVNIEFVKNNARMAAKIARELAEVDNGVSMQIPPELVRPAAPSPPKNSETGEAPAPTTAKPSGKSPVKVAVVGSISQDLTCTLNTENVSVSSYPGHVTTSIGGVARNVAQACTYTGVSTRLISEIGEREKDAILRSAALDTTGISINPAKRSARYVSMNDCNGALIVACSDMESIEKMDLGHIQKELERASPEVVVFDANLGRQQMQKVIDFPAIKLFEPTSIPKSATLANTTLKCFPDASITMATPNSMELMSMFEEFSYNDRFDLEHWFPVIDSIPLDNPQTQYKLQLFIRRSPEALENIVQSGLVQAAIHLLPYIPNLFVKLGEHGVLTFQIIEFLRDRTADIYGTNSVYIPGKHNRTVLIQHFPIPEEIPQSQIKSVSGIGDTFCGVLAAELAKSKDWLRDDSDLKREKINLAQMAAGLSLQTFAPVNSDIAELF